jgi:hypothetical protein
MPLGHTISCNTTDKEVTMTTFPIKTTIDVYRDEEDNSRLAERLGFTNDDIFTETIYHMGEHFTLKLEITEDGTATVTHFNGVALVTPVELH